MSNFESITIGDVRSRWLPVHNGYQMKLRNHKFINFNTSGWVKVTETFQYTYPSSEMGQHWVITSVYMDTFTKLDPNRPLPAQSEPDQDSFPVRKWWQRFLGLSNLPKARIHNE